MHWIPMTWRGNNMSSDIPVLSVRNLSVSYKEKSVVKNVSFDLRSGESIALVGRKRMWKVYHFTCCHEDFAGPGTCFRR